MPAAPPGKLEDPRIGNGIDATLPLFGGNDRGGGLHKVLDVQIRFDRLPGARPEIFKVIQDPKQIIGRDLVQPLAGISAEAQLHRSVARPNRELINRLRRPVLPAQDFLDRVSVNAALAQRAAQMHRRVGGFAGAGGLIEPEPQELCFARCKF